MIMPDTIAQPQDESPTCICGALLADGQQLCRKCAARQRWIRRQNARLRADRRRGETRRPPRNPHRMSALGATR
ncbi:hypothetical protein Aph01nite_68110 [Acrocarpospora phusangensis]|uniref:Uncharacterized protein n=2 Tax=Acrocarpospora phusangensis TaxID=1070424 RepID=A0A919UNH0_9ACTN|nr:hypothetical protein Aph01nite_68110 [Acrocarpospora phusangensis]